MASTLVRMAGHAGSYSRYGGGREQLKGVLIERDYEVIDDEGIVTLTKSFDWLFQVSSLGHLFPPQPGDNWKPDRDCSAECHSRDSRWNYTAMTLGKKPCFDMHDQQGCLVIVHTKRVASA